MIFRATPLRFEFEAKDELRFPPGKAGNTLRGALGSILPESLFAPHARGEGPSGLEDRPRPWVLRASHLDGQTFRPGDRFAMTVNAFRTDLFPDFRQAFERITRVGPERREVKLVGAIQEETIGVDLAEPAHAKALRIRFVTPMELKFNGAILREPRFEALMSRVRDRIAALCELYQGGAPDVGYRGIGERSRAIAMTAARIEQIEIERRSSRTQQSHSLGGFVGEAEYEGELGEFLPWLKAAEWTGAGRYTVWGNGAILVSSNYPADEAGTR